MTCCTVLYSTYSIAVKEEGRAEKLARARETFPKSLANKKELADPTHRSEPGKRPRSRSRF